jgi:hypothetical protein
VYDQVLEFLPRIPNEVRRLKNVIESPEVPKVDIGNHCSDPYDCDFKGTCWKHIPDYSVFNISRLNKDKKFDLYNQGVIKLDQIDLSQTDLIVWNSILDLCLTNLIWTLALIRSMNPSFKNFINNEIT